MSNELYPEDPQLEPDAPHDGQVPPVLVGEPPAVTTPAPSAEQLAPPVASDFPPPPALSAQSEHEFNEDEPAAVGYQKLGSALARTGDLYRSSDYRGGLRLASPTPRVPAGPVTTPDSLACLIADRLRVRRVKGGKAKGNCIPSQHLRTALAAESFLQQFRPLDRVDERSRYLTLLGPAGDEFHLTRPGYFDGGPGRRVLHTGPEPEIFEGLDTINRFLDVMAFHGPADRTNAVAAALTVLLGDAWPGGKPLLAYTSTKSHGGKDTLICFASGSAPRVSVSYQETDWAMEFNFVRAVKSTPGLGVLVIENARLDGPGRYIRSAILERFLTDPEPLLGSVGTGAPVRRRNDLTIAVSTNHGQLSEDLMNRALPIHLAPVGDVAGRRAAIGNPKLEYLPANRERIEAELRGMVERWRAAGRPLDRDVRHPFGPWAATVGGILQSNGFTDFLANYGRRRTADDPRRAALGLLGAAAPGQWLRPGEWVRHMVRAGLTEDLIARANRTTDAGRERGLGKVLSDHTGETFVVDTDEEPPLLLRLDKDRRRVEGSEGKWRYAFMPIPANGSAA